MADRTWQEASTGTALLDHPTAPLPPFAEGILHRLELAFAPQVVANFDNHGSLWGFEAVEQAEAGIAEERANGTAIDEWNVADRDGQPLRIVRMVDPTFLDTIAVFSTWNPYASPVLAEQHRIERRLAGLAVGESAVVNGTECTVIDVATADLLERDRAVSAECRRRSATAVTSADFDALLCVQDELAFCRCQLGAAS